MSDPDRNRPVAPDPQQDRHVAFPDELPRPRGSLPPEAWAAHGTAATGSSSTASSAPGPATTPATSILTSPVPPAQPRRRGRRRWAGLLLVLLFFGAANHSGSERMSDGCTGDSSASPGMWDCTFESSTDGDLQGGSAIGVWATDVTASTRPLAPVLVGSQPVKPVPADATTLRVEFVSDPGPGSVVTETEASASGAPIDVSGDGAPRVLEVHLDARPTDLTASVRFLSGSGTVQCRVYAGSTLVAIDTSGSHATCTPAF